ncbi:Na/Pi symporter [bacterium]|nr:Na/Pi symporter [bacterium]MBU1959495.1 Na/Pi symporter [bacterium]
MESSYQSIFQAIGGVGLFLLGMTIMTDGLKALAGKQIRSALMRFTKSPTSGAMTGAVSTMILQSSSATIVASVGFVAVGMMQFTESLGIIFGANIGTTITGWLVVLFGFKFKLAEIALPLIFLGMVLKLFFKGRVATVGYTVAGFSLIFVGITLMQEGMQGFEGILSLDTLPADSWIGRLQLLALGMVATLITQSSSAGVAATLTMLFSHVINFEQAAALVIGMDLGTTVTPLIATIGGSTEVKRTGLSHVIYNFFTAVGAFFLITPYLYTWDFFSTEALVENAEIALVGFHTLFNTLGVLFILPFTRYFARLIEYMLPLESARLYRLDDALPTKAPKLALIASLQALEKIFKVSLDYVDTHLDGLSNKSLALVKIEKSVDNIQEYMDEIVLNESKEKEWKQLIALFHGLNHLERLVDRCETIEKHYQVIKHSEELKRIWRACRENHEQLRALFQANNVSAAFKLSDKTTKMSVQELDQLRDEVILKIAKDEIDSYSGLEILNTIKWLKRILKHIHTFIFYYEKALVT